MKSPNPVNLPGLEDKTFLLLVIAVTLAFAWILWPFYGAVLWGTILAILFAPLDRRLRGIMGQRRTLAALATVVIVLLIVILPLILIGGLLLQEAVGVYEKFKSGEINFGRYFQQVLDALPAWITTLLDRFGLTNLGVMQDKLSSNLMQGSQFVATKAFDYWPEHVRSGDQSLHCSLPAVLFRARRRRSRQTHQDCRPFASASAARAFRYVRYRDSRQRQRQRRYGNRPRNARRADILDTECPCAGALGGGYGFVLAAAGHRHRPDLASGGDLFFGHRRDLAGHCFDRLWRVRHRPGRQPSAADPRWVKTPNYRTMSCWFPPLAAWPFSGSMVLSSGR